MSAEPSLQGNVIETSIALFFQVRRFAFPPIDAERNKEHTQQVARRASHEIDQAAWDNILPDSHTASFTFPIRPDETRTIAYSRQLNKVVQLNSDHP